MTTIVENTTNVNEILQLVSFKIGNEEFGVDILKVQEINRMLNITEVPNSPKFVNGVVNLRGRIIPVIDTRIKLNLPIIKHDHKTRIIIVELKGKTAGFIVDEVSEVLRIPKNITEAPPAIISGINSDYIIAVAKLEERLLILLDLEKILSTKETETLEVIQ
ncbi:MAG: chemotaxis protein CheW [Melioribacteraceae bacterium]|nr:chemotaxis protein CheW [Melioribacteraceae bacterium]